MSEMFIGAVALLLFVGVPLLAWAYYMTWRDRRWIKQAAVREREPVKSLEERTAVLEYEVGEYIHRGYTVVTRTETTAHLHRGKRFSWVLAVFLFLAGFLTFGITWLILLLQFLLYAGERTHTVHLTVDEHGYVVKR